MRLVTGMVGDGRRRSDGNVGAAMVRVAFEVGMIWSKVVTVLSEERARDATRREECVGNGVEMDMLEREGGIRRSSARDSSPDVVAIFTMIYIKRTLLMRG